MTRATLRRLVWGSLSAGARLREGSALYAWVASEGRYVELEGLTEAELLGLLPPSLREQVTARLNEGTDNTPSATLPAKQPGAASRPGPKKAKVPPAAETRRRSGKTGS